jgi:hypothetical protein
MPGLEMRWLRANIVTAFVPEARCTMRKVLLKILAWCETRVELLLCLSFIC